MDARAVLPAEPSVRVVLTAEMSRGWYRPECQAGTAVVDARLLLTDVCDLPREGERDIDRAGPTADETVVGWRKVCLCRSGLWGNGVECSPLVVPLPAGVC